MQPDLFTRHPDFDGETYERPKDAKRLGAQLTKVKTVLSDGEWHTPQELEILVGANWSSISARLRDLRKPQFGGYQVERLRVDGGLFAYRLVK